MSTPKEMSFITKLLILTRIAVARFIGRMAGAAMNLLKTTGLFLVWLLEWPLSLLDAGRIHNVDGIGSFGVIGREYRMAGATYIRTPYGLVRTSGPTTDKTRSLINKVRMWRRGLIRVRRIKALSFLVGALALAAILYLNQ